ncbi:MAG: molecular chaperone, partial [Thermodesulfobacteriota bacterium]
MKPFKILSLLAVLTGLLAGPCLFPHHARAGVFRVTPIRLDFTSKVRTGLVTILSEGPEELKLQVRAYEWTQDEEGKDVYRETGDLIFFPRMMALGENQEKTLRAGIRVPPPPVEKTYRLFIEEITGPRKKKTGANVAMAIRFGIPIFVTPEREAPAGELEGL